MAALHPASDTGDGFFAYPAADPAGSRHTSALNMHRNLRAVELPLLQTSRGCPLRISPSCDTPTAPVSFRDLR